MLVKTLKWPVISLLITGALHFMLEAAVPDLKTIFTPPVLAPLLLSFGAWVGFRAVRNGGNLIHALIAAAILGLLPIILDVFGFGMILGRGVAAGTLAGLFGFAMIVWGALVGSGYAMSKGESNL